jgi:hypothetical protein
MNNVMKIYMREIMNNIEGFVEDNRDKWDDALEVYAGSIRCSPIPAKKDSNCSASQGGASELCSTFCTNKNTNEKCEIPAYVFEGGLTKDVSENVCTWEASPVKDRELGGKKDAIAAHIIEINGEIAALQGALSSTSYSMDQKLRQYNENKGNTQMNQDLAAEPLKDEQLRFSNYTYGPLIYYPVGCIFLSFLIYKKL